MYCMYTVCTDLYSTCMYVYSVHVHVCTCIMVHDGVQLISRASFYVCVCWFDVIFFFTFRDTMFSLPPSVWSCQVDSQRAACGSHTRAQGCCQQVRIIILVHFSLVELLTITCTSHDLTDWGCFRILLRLHLSLTMVRPSCGRWGGWKGRLWSTSPRCRTATREGRSRPGLSARAIRASLLPPPMVVFRSSSKKITW